MHKQTTKIDVLWGAGLFILSLVFLFALSGVVAPQATMDAAYYHIMTDQLESGKGFTEPVLWNYLNPRDEIEHPMDYWMPAGIVYYYLARLFAGISGEIGINIIVWSLLATAVFFWTFLRTNCRFSAVAAFLVTLLGGRNLFYVLTTDNLALYALFGLAFMYILDAKKWNSFAGGVLAGLLILTRIEGTLIAGSIWILAFLRSKSSRTLLATVCITLLVILPWIIRNQIVLGKIWTSNLKSLLIVNYTDIFSPEFSGTWNEFVSQGFSSILQQRLKGFFTSLMQFIIIPGLFVFYPLWWAGLKSLWESIGRGFTCLLWLMFLFCAILIPIQAERGTALHISAFFQTFYSVITGVGLHCLFQKFASSNRQKVLMILLLASWAGVGTLYSIARLNANYLEVSAPYTELAKMMPQIKANKVLSVSPIRLYVETGARGVMLSGATKISASALAKKYDCDLIILDKRSENAQQTIGHPFIRTATTEHLEIFKKTPVTAR